MSDKDPPTARKLTRHVFVCTNERTPGHPRGDCKSKHSEELVPLFKETLKAKGVGGTVRAQKAGCLDTCEWGPSVVVYPDNVWYGRVTPADVAEIIESHLVGGVPVDRLRIAGK